MARCLTILKSLLIAVAGRVGEVDAIVPVAVEVNEPSPLVVTENKACCSKRCSCLAHVLIIYCLYLVVVVIVECTAGRTHIPDFGIIGVLCLADSTDGLDVELIGDLEVDTPLNTVVNLINTCH